MLEDPADAILNKAQSGLQGNFDLSLAVYETTYINLKRVTVLHAQMRISLSFCTVSRNSLIVLGPQGIYLQSMQISSLNLAELSCQDRRIAQGGAECNSIQWTMCKLS